MAGFIQRDVVLNSRGNPVAGATITVGTSIATGIPCSPTATIYTDETLGTPKANPFTSDGLGNFSFAVPFGSTFVVTVTGAGLDGYSYRITTPQQNDVTQINLVEQGSAPSGVAGSDILYGKTSDHRIHAKLNNGSEIILDSIPTIVRKKGSGTGNYTHGGDTNYTDVDGTNLSYTVTIPSGWKLCVHASGSGGTTVAATYFLVALVDGSIINEHTYFSSTIGISMSWALDYEIDGDGASHTIKLQYKTSNGADSVIIENSSATLVPTMIFRLEPSN